MGKYEESTEGILVRVDPDFSLARSDLGERRFVFSYRVHMENQGAEHGRLLYRHWRIHDAGAGDSEVDGEGVVGVQPELAPGEAHAYESFCVLTSPSGYMQGHYVFQRPDGRRFRVAIPRFHLDAPLPSLDPWGRGAGGGLH
ncbi:MAG: Co2+/Mg2+ efflux protein ApaG [Longimicrobiales bacterium]|nr:Co2+/Mg2+ efflux protein ApaG [Longimicrobiales bacterium]